MRHLPLLLALALAGAATSAELVDPTSDLRYATALADLELLQAGLRAKPDDQVLLGQAAQCYVNLSLMGERVVDGAYGPWLGYARQVVEHRRALRSGAAATDIAAAAPELWVELLSGEAVGVLDALKRYDRERSSPAWQALAAMASRDPHAVIGEHPTPLQRIARSEAWLMIGDHYEVKPLRFEEGLEPFVVSWLLNRANNPQRPEAMFGEIYGSIVATYARADVDDAVAQRALRSLLEAAAATVPADAGRRALLAAAEAAASAMKPTDYGWLIASYPLCRGLRTTPRVLAWPTPVLLTAGDLAAWNYDRLYQAGLRALTRYDDKYRPAILALVKDAPELVTARRVALTSNDKPSRDEDIIALAAALRGALQDGVEPADPTIICSACAATDRLPEHSRDVVRQLASAFVGLPAWRQRPLLERIGTAALRCGVGAELGPVVRAAAERDPFDTDLHRLKRQYDPEERLVDWATVKPSATWVDATVDHAALPWPQTEAQRCFAVRWVGSIDLAAGGTYEIATESDDGSRAAIGDAIIDNSGFHGAQRRSVEVAGGGPRPIRIDYVQGEGGASCRLLWKPPGAADFAVVPASALSHGGDEPGLAASIAVFPDLDALSKAMTPSAAECAFVKGMPWQAALLDDVALAFYRAARFDDAIPFYEMAERATGMDAKYRSRLGACLLLGPRPDLDRGIGELVAGGIFPAEDYETIWLPNLAQVLQRANRAPDLLSRYPWHDWASNDNAVHGLLLMGTGDFAGAHACFRGVMKVIQPGHYGMSMPLETWTDVFLYDALLTRMYDGREPDLRRARRLMEFWHAARWQLDTLAWLAGETTYEQALAKQTSADERDALAYAHAILDLTLGDHDAARAGLEKQVARHPDARRTPLAQNLLAWYAQQTPESLARLPKAKPLPTPAGDAPPTRKSGDF